MKFIFYLIFHLRLLFLKMNTFKTEDVGYEKFWLAGAMTIFIELNFSSIDNMFFGNYLHIHHKYIFILIIPIIMFVVYYLLINRQIYLEYNFKESYKGYLGLFILFIITIVLMFMVIPRKNY